MALIDGGERWCVHKWSMIRGPIKMPVGEYRYGIKYRYTDEYQCLKCGAKSTSDLGSPPNFMNFLLPFFLVVGAIGGVMSATVFWPFAIGSALCVTGLIWWINQILE